MHKKKRLCPPQLWALAALLLLVAVAPGCPRPPQTLLDEIGMRPGNDGFRNLLIGEERLVSLEEGNLSEDTASDPQERLDVLEAFVQEYAQFFGASAAKMENLLFLAAAEEQQAVFNETEFHETVFLNQEHLGAIVLDAQILGEFVGLPDGAKPLRRVQGRLFDPAGLPDPVPAGDDTRREAMQQFLTFLRENEITDGTRTVLPVPVILGEKSITGFLSHYVFSYEDGSMDRLSAIVNPVTEQIHILYSMPACRAHNALGDGL